MPPVHNNEYYNNSLQVQIRTSSGLFSQTLKSSFQSHRNHYKGWIVLLMSGELILMCKIGGVCLYFVSRRKKDHCNHYIISPFSISHQHQTIKLLISEVGVHNVYEMSTTACYLFIALQLCAFMDQTPLFSHCIDTKGRHRLRLKPHCSAEKKQQHWCQYFC